MLCLCTIINKKPFSIMISTPRCGDQKKKTQSPALWLCARRREVFVKSAF